MKERKTLIEEEEGWRKGQAGLSFGVGGFDKVLNFRRIEKDHIEKFI